MATTTAAAIPNNPFPRYFSLHLSLVALLAGERPPRLDQPFRLVEFGCGQGFGLCLQAALHPDASFCGIDLLASHISHARHLAADAGLANLTSQDADLINLASFCGDIATSTAQAPPPPLAALIWPSAMGCSAG